MGGARGRRSHVTEKFVSTVLQLAGFGESLAPGALLTIGRGDYHGRRVRFAGVIINRGRGLRAEVAALGVEVQCADAVCTLGAGELHSALDALDLIGFHWPNCSPSAGGSGYALVGQLR